MQFSYALPAGIEHSYMGDAESITMTMRIVSAAFEDQEFIPARHTCDGEDLSPSLSWEGVPEGTGSLALVVDDPDCPTGTWVHWMMYDIPPSMNGLGEGISTGPELGFGAKHGKNSWKRFGYGGPCPPAGKPHRYVFKLFALDTPLNIDPGAGAKLLMKVIEGHVIERAEIVGLYARSLP
jgi:Raf kinase inhibitor-like YbhB/YbcL family protein